MKRTVHWIVAGWMSIFLCSVCFAEMRTWTSKEGETVVAQYVERQNGVVVLEMDDGHQIRIQFDHLGDRCRRYVGEALASSERAEASPGGEPPPLLFVGDFEHRNSLNRLGDTGLEHTLKKVEIVSDPVRHGRGALKLTLDREAPDDPKAYRTDFWIRGMSNVFEMGEEYWYGFSTLL